MFRKAACYKVCQYSSIKRSFIEHSGFLGFVGVCSVRSMLLVPKYLIFALRQDKECALSSCVAALRCCLFPVLVPSMALELHLRFWLHIFFGAIDIVAQRVAKV